MKRWLSRSFWLAAWSFWLWLGFGLHRELPRDFGLPITSFPVKLAPRFLGFIGGTNDFAILNPDEDGDTSGVRVFDAETGQQRRTIPGPSGREYIYGPLLERGRHDVLFAKQTGARGRVAEKHGLFVLDLVQGSWQRLTERSPEFVQLHPSQPLVVVVDGEPHERRVGVIDYRNGKTHFSHDQFVAAPTQCAPVFLERDEGVVVPTQPTGAGEIGEIIFEIWKLHPLPKLERAIPGFAFGKQPSVSANGRVAITHGTDPWCVDVFGVSEGRLLFSLPEMADRPSVLARGGIPTAVSTSGRTVLAGKGCKLYDVDSGQPVWEAGKYQRSTPFARFQQFMVFEPWYEAWKGWFPSFQFEAHCFRNIEDGSLVYRRIGRTITQTQNWNASRTLAVANDGNVYRHPLSVNYLLLALCQAILALPLVLLWAVLRWRRKRRLRQASVAP